MPVAGTTNFGVGDAGRVLDIDRAVILIKDAMRSPTSRVVNLTYKQIGASRPTIQNLEIMLQQLIDVSGFDGFPEVYMLDLQTRQEINFAYSLGDTIPPGVAFTAASTMKIPIMVSVYRRQPEPAPEEVTELVELMIERSENDPADRLMQRVMDENMGPLQVTDDFQRLGLENTFLAGYFRIGAPLLRRFETPANTRTDYSTDPDPYNQTTTAEIGMVLDDLYQCSQDGGGTFAVVFPGDISRSECQLMIDYLASNQIGVLIQAGLPEGTRVANKHGWIVEGDGLLHTFGDAGIVYTPGGNFILVIFMHQPTQLIFDPANQLVADLARAVYNYFNLNVQ
jgi:beta-lactamase class A